LRAGFDPELDKLRDLSKNGKSYIASLETKEREHTGLTSLKVGFNSVFGYYLEVPKAHIARVPAEYIRKQTTANAERYITAELKEHESLVLGADEKATALEADLFGRLRSRVAEHDQALLQTARALAEIDVYAALADVAVRRKYVRPEMSEKDELWIEGGRHPVVEAAGAAFVPNDADIAPDDGRVLVLTGPNMAGKSTYLRQIALIVLMAQIGSFVPARSCRLGLCDRVFARIGARDELASGQSTFMVEMSEAANILNHATERSLVILDEVGRGTSTYDGLAIAWAILERLVEIGAKTLFATHYHQLNALADQTSAVQNLRASVEEVGEDIVWTHKVLPGGTDRSYGIHVARAAGVPGSVLVRARNILDELEDKAAAPRAAPTTQKLQLTLFEAEAAPVMKELEGLDVNSLTPMDALRILDDWKRKFGAT
jgi:DNA mismatch repair protein MutS